MSIRFHTHFRPIAERYDGVILDLWGVVHDGVETYPDARATLLALKAAGKRVVFLSNAPRRANRVIEVLESLNIDPTLYHAVVSSGEAAYRYLSRLSPMPYYYLGPERDATLSPDLHHARVETLAQAKFILNAGHPNDDPSTDLDPLLTEAAERNIPLLCINPDMEVVRLNGERSPCAGVIAERFEELGGNAAYFGKPYGDVYGMCMEHFSSTPRQKIVAVGDGMLTDIAGAEQANIDSVLVTGGILKDEFDAQDSPHVLQEKVTRYCHALDICPHYAIPNFAWDAR